MNSEASVRYRINDRDEITFVSAEWDQFAESNDGADAMSHHVIGRIIWDFISDENTRQLYRHMIQRIRQGHIARFQLRCDSPSHKRSLEMTIQAVETDSVEFVTQTLHVEARAPMVVICSGTPRAMKPLKVCSWCNRVEADADEWIEVDAAVEALKLFEAIKTQRITHSICATCFQTISKTLDVK